MNSHESATLEDFYSALADAIDRAGPEQESLLLAKLALLLAHELGEPVRAVASIAEAARDLGKSTTA